MRCRFGEPVQQVYLPKERRSSFWVEVVDEFPDGLLATAVAVVDGLKVSQRVSLYRSICLLRSLVRTTAHSSLVQCSAVLSKDDLVLSAIGYLEETTFRVNNLNVEATSFAGRCAGNASW